MSEDENKISNSIEFLLSLDKSQLIDNKTVYDDITFLKNSSTFIDFDSLSDKNFDQVLVNILLEVNTAFLKSESDVMHKNIDKIFLLNSCLSLIYSGALKSIKFSRQISSQNGLEAHFNFLKDPNFINVHTELRLDDKSGSNFNLIEKIISNIYIFSKSSYLIMEKWVELDSIKTLLKISTINQNLKLDSYLTIINLLSDKEIQNLKEIHEIVEFVQEIFQKISQDFRNKNFNRQFRQVTENNEVLNVQVYCYKKTNGLFLSLFVFLSGLYELSVNNQLKRDIYFKNEFKKNLQSILLESNEIEMLYALRLYAQLSFSPEVSLDMEQNLELMNFFENSLKSTKNVLTEKLIKQIFWNVHQNKLSKKTNEIKSQGNHVMISYNSKTRDLCMKIKSRLEINGHKVWIDIGNIHGSSLDSMAKAVEESYCVLICITEKYRQSIYCQSEAQYAYKLNKPIIPLIMQKDYENVKGWLGIVISDKIFVNFMKYSFEECIQRLEGEINTITNKEVSINKNGNEKKSISSWDESQVNEWFINNKIDMKIYEKFLPFNGVILQQLYEMRRDAPEFYYQSIKFKDTEQIDLNSIMNFTHLLKTLFESN
ncbi:unnamed protein product [Brachionus calyciflorus]|uniref:TIR domain-containing protein n=1 Tax=Brachionus calyciflorus TaxID=104777 RepID=A0A813Z7B3_9BILA|nr:unnamed protein product [Brachionus calyciflorus]